MQPITREQFDEALKIASSQYYFICQERVFKEPGQSHEFTNALFEEINKLQGNENDSDNQRAT